jgi:glycosyltransferase involved in cell wall biosynthesis
VLSYRVIQSFPGSKTLWAKGADFQTPEGIPVHLVPFLNLTPLKQLMIGVMTTLSLLQWNWRHRRTPHRIVCTYNLTVPPGIFVWLGARLGRARVVVLLCDVNVPGQTVPNTVPTRLDWRMQQWLIPKFDGWISVCDAAMEDLAPGRQYLRMEGGISPEAVQRISRRDDARRNPTQPFTMVAAGRIDETNGFHIMLEAMKVLPSNFRLIIAGIGPLRATAESAAARDPRIEYRGLLPFDQVLDLYFQADLLLNVRVTRALHTRYFFPSKFMEYAASGTPVLTTATGHIPTEFADFVYILEDETPSGLARLIQQIASEPTSARAERARGAQRYMFANKTWAAQSRRVYDYLLERVTG